MSVKAKFYCNNVQQHGPNMVSVNLHAVIGSEKGEDGLMDYAGDNKQWSKATPSGSLSLTLTNSDAFNQFESGKEYYLMIAAVEKVPRHVFEADDDDDDYTEEDKPEETV